jgi:pseudouridine-5'-phosphate glycosidase
MAANAPVVALESSVIAQGLPRPQNFDAALQIEASVRDSGATPATLAVLDGVVHVGLDRTEIEHLAFSDGIEKAGLRDLGRAIATAATMATTVGSSLGIARALGLRVLATGGIGGVHRGAAETGDVSNDLQVLADCSSITVCSGMKSILDLSRTLEYLEMLGVAVVGYGTDTLPNFYSVDSGIPVPRLDDVATIAAMLRAQDQLEVSTGIVVVNPPPAEYAFEAGELDELVDGAISAAAAQHVAGKAVTPFLLSHIAAATHGRSVTLNIALLRSNAAVAGEIAAALLPAPV